MKTFQITQVHKTMSSPVEDSVGRQHEERLLKVEADRSVRVEEGLQGGEQQLAAAPSGPLLHHPVPSPAPLHLALVYLQPTPNGVNIVPVQVLGQAAYAYDPLVQPVMLRGATLPLLPSTGPASFPRPQLFRPWEEVGRRGQGAGGSRVSRVTTSLPSDEVETLEHGVHQMRMV